MTDAAPRLLLPTLGLAYARTVAQDISWLPERHLPVAATLAHADQIFGQLTDVLFDYQATPDGTLGLKEVRAGSVSRTTVTSVAPLPRSVPLLAADVLTTLRAAVEHTLYAEVEHANRRELSPAEARLVEMPAALTAEKFEGWVRDRTKRGAAKPLQPGSPLLDRIRKLQPYRGGSSPEAHPLALLVSHSNLAKHRMPAIAALRLAMIRPDEGTVLDPRVRIPNPVEGPLKVGDALAETPLGVQVPVSLYPTIGLNRPGTDRWPVLVKELEAIASWVRTQAVPVLVTGTPDVDPLPPTYDIDHGHLDERSAIGLGTRSAAHERYLRRLEVTIVRDNLAEMVAAHPGHPDRGPIKRWIAHLTDEELLDRMGRFRPGRTVAAAAHTFRLVDEMLKEVQAFDRSSGGST